MLRRLPEIIHFKTIKKEPFESAAATEERLEGTYLSELDREVLNRFTIPFMGVKNIDRARELERAERNAETLNRLARVIEILEAFGMDAEEAKAMRKEYAELQRSRFP